MTERLRPNGPSFFASCLFRAIKPLEVRGALLLEDKTASLSPSWEPCCRGVVLLETVEESDTKVSVEPESLQQELSDGFGGLALEALEEQALEDGRDVAGLDSSRLPWLTVRTLLRLRPRLISTTSIDGGRTALGMILDM